MNDDTFSRILNSWTIRKEMLLSIIEIGDTFIETFKHAPEMKESLLFESWKRIVSENVEKATKLYGKNGEPLFTQEILTLALLTLPHRGS